MRKLSDMPNIGAEIERQLIEVEIETCEKLISVGSKEAFKRILKIDSSACINKLYALEGAIQGIRWHNLSHECKAELKEFYASARKEANYL